jgi:hypothetical protein
MSMYLSWLVLGCATLARADGWQVYYPKNPNIMGQGVPTSVYTAGIAAFTGSAAYNTAELTIPALPNPMPALSFNIQLYSGGMANLSIPQSAFMGFSIEMSVSTQVCT